MQSQLAECRYKLASRPCLERPRLLVPGRSAERSKRLHDGPALKTRAIDKHRTPVTLDLADPHAEQKFDVAAGLLEFVEHQLHRFNRGYARERAPEDDDLVVLVRMVEQFLFPSA